VGLGVVFGAFKGAFSPDAFPPASGERDSPPPSAGDFFSVSSAPFKQRMIRFLVFRRVGCSSRAHTSPVRFSRAGGSLNTPLRRTCEGTQPWPSQRSVAVVAFGRRPLSPSHGVVPSFLSSGSLPFELVPRRLPPNCRAARLIGVVRPAPRVLLFCTRSLSRVH